MVVDAVSMLDELLPLNMIGIKKVQGGSLEDSALVKFDALVVLLFKRSIKFLKNYRLRVLLSKKPFPMLVLKCNRSSIATLRLPF
jgi:hypothetical protein